MAEEQEWGYWFSPWHNSRPNSLLEKPGTQDPGISFYKERKTGIEERMRRTLIEEGRKMGLSWELIEEAYYYFVKLHRLKTMTIIK